MSNPDARNLLLLAADVMSGERTDTHGEPVETMARVARLWEAFLRPRLREDETITAECAALMLALLKIARTQGGATNQDDYLDGAAYVAIAHACAARGLSYIAAAACAAPDVDPSSDEEEEEEEDKPARPPPATRGVVRALWGGDGTDDSGGGA